MAMLVYRRVYRQFLSFEPFDGNGSTLEGFDKVWKTLTLEHQRFLAERLVAPVASALEGEMIKIM